MECPRFQLQFQLQEVRWQQGQPVDLEVFYPHPPERVWQVLTDRRSLTHWMMDNDFEPQLGHKFQFYSQPLPGLKTVIHCEIVELEEPSRLVYTWKDTPTAEPSLVVWTLTPTAGGTQLRLKHHQYSYATAEAALRGYGSHPQHDFYSRACDRSGLKPASLLSPGLEIFAEGGTKSSSYPSGWSSFDRLQFQPFTWEYFLNQTLPEVLREEPVCR